jgi:hypothetical protein
MDAASRRNPELSRGDDRRNHPLRLVAQCAKACRFPIADLLRTITAVTNSTVREILA